MLVRGAGFPVTDVLALAEPALAALARLAVENPVTRATFDAAWADARARQRLRLRDVAGSPRFREAVTWQNRGALVTGLDALLRQPPERDDSRTRKKELLVASYLQRYATKCETIGFFGPVGWGRWDAGQGEAVRAAPGPSLLDARATYFEPWALEALVDALGGTREVAELIPLRLAGMVRLERAGARLRIAGEPGTTEDDALLVSLVDGKRHARALATHARRRFPKRFPDVPAAVDRLFALVEAGVLLPALPMAIEAHPERRLLAAAKRLASPARERLVGALHQLEEARASVAAAAGDAAALAPAMEALEATFNTITGQAATRHAGRAYAGRVLVYEETRRAGVVTLGEALRETLSEPLALLLDASRAFTARVAQGFLRGVERRFDALGGRAVPLDVLWRETADLFDGQPPAVVAREVAALQARFAKAAPVDEAQREQRFASVDVRRALGRFLTAEVGPAWPGARHHSPDVMLAVQGGEVTPVLGELHVGVTPFTTLSVLAHCPVRAELEALYAQDIPGPHVTPVPWEDFARSTHDARLAKDARRWHVDLGFRATSPLPPARVLRVADLVVRRHRGELVVTKGAFRAPLLAVLERRMKLRAAGELHPFAWTAHRPRLWLDGVVVAREAWRAATASLAWAASSDGRERFLGATAWAAARGFPRFVFVRSPAEVKPVYVDFESPALVDLLCRFVRGAPEVVVTEMLPAPDALWLPDADGKRFVCELRMLAVDARRA
ncbi:MAG: lantibiotic dehydratase [Myxococcota bacterium]